MFGFLKKIVKRKVGELEAKMLREGSQFEKAGEVEFEFYSDGTVKVKPAFKRLGFKKGDQVSLAIDNTEIKRLNVFMGFIAAKKESDRDLHPQFIPLVKPDKIIRLVSNGQILASGRLVVD